LRDGKHCPARIHQTPIHFAGVVRKDSQLDDFVDQEINVSLGVGLCDPKKDQQSETDFANDCSVDFDLSLGDAL